MKKQETLKEMVQRIIKEEFEILRNFKSLNENDSDSPMMDKWIPVLEKFSKLVTKKIPDSKTYFDSNKIDNAEKLKIQFSFADRSIKDRIIALGRQYRIIPMTTWSGGDRMSVEFMPNEVYKYLKANNRY